MKKTETVDDPVIAYQDLGEAILDEVLVRAGIDQGRSPGDAEIRLALDFVVSVDEEQNHLVIRSERIGQSALELRLEVGEAPAEWRTSARAGKGGLS